MRFRLFLVSCVVGCYYLTPFWFLFHLNLLDVFLSVNTVKEGEGRRREKISSQFQLYFIWVFARLLSYEVMSSRTIENRRFSQIRCEIC